MKSIEEEISRLKKENLYRTLKTLYSPQSPEIKIKGDTFILLSSNNYLGLTTHPLIKKKAMEALEKYGTGSGASRLISGNLFLYDELEKEIAGYKGTEAALVFSSGYAANVGTISSLVEKGDIIFSDELNHASIIDGCRLSGALISIYPHKDITYLERHLKKSKKYGKRLIITDSIFSMDGDIAPLPDILELTKRYNALLFVDDAHATGILGKRGRGSAEHFNLEGNIDIYMGTLSKAIGSMGGFISGRKELIDFLINCARSLIYSTALPPSALAAALSALKLIGKDLSLKESLWKNVNFLKEGLISLGYDLLNSQTHIIPVLMKKSERALKASDYLYRKGIFVPAIRPPTVPDGESRLRVTLMANHKRKDLEYVLEKFKSLKKIL